MKIDHGMMVVALDGRKMIVLRNEGDARYPALEVILKREAENPRAADQGRDRPGRTYSRFEPRRSALDENDQHEQQEGDFVAAAAESLDAAGNDADARFILLADPTALGKFRKCCAPRLAGRIVAEIPRNVAHHTTDDITKAVSDHEKN